MPAHGTPMPIKGPSQPASMPGTGTAMWLLLAINLFNYIDRQVLAAVEPEIRKEILFGEKEDEAKFKMGLLSSGFLFTYMFIAPLFGRLADRFSRWLLVGIGVLVWTLASGASGLDWHLSLGAAFWVLFMTRCVVGVGEGGYVPGAPARCSGLYAVQTRGQARSCFALAIPT